MGVTHNAVQWKPVNSAHYKKVRKKSTISIFKHLPPPCNLSQICLVLNSQRPDQADKEHLHINDAVLYMQCVFWNVLFVVCNMQCALCSVQCAVQSCMLMSCYWKLSDADLIWMKYKLYKIVWIFGQSMCSRVSQSPLSERKEQLHLIHCINQSYMRVFFLLTSH